MSVVATTGTASTGSRARWARNTVRSRSPASVGIDISWTEVTPRDAARAAALSCSSWISWSDNASRVHRARRCIASCVTLPSGEPLGSRRVPGSSHTSDARRAAEFASARWKSVLLITSGRSVTASSSASDGKSGASQRLSSNPCSSTRPLPSPARAAARSSSSARERAAATASSADESPVLVRWTCVSMNPGTSVAPGSSTVRSAAGGSPLPTRCTWRPSTRIHSPVAGCESVWTRAAR